MLPAHAISHLLWVSEGEKKKKGFERQVNVQKSRTEKILTKVGFIYSWNSCILTGKWNSNKTSEVKGHLLLYMNRLLSQVEHSLCLSCVTSHGFKFLFFQTAWPLKMSMEGKITISYNGRKIGSYSSEAVCYTYREHSSNFLGHCWTDLKCMSKSPPLKIKDSLDSILLSFNLLYNEFRCDQTYTKHIICCK